MATFYSTAKAAERSTLSQRRVQQYVKDGTLKTGSDGINSGITGASLSALCRRLAQGLVKRGPKAKKRRRAKR